MSAIHKQAGQQQRDNQNQWTNTHFMNFKYHLSLANLTILLFLPAAANNKGTTDKKSKMG